jgi:hypothetical protein
VYRRTGVRIATIAYKSFDNGWRWSGNSPAAVALDVNNRARPSRGRRRDLARKICEALDERAVTAVQECILTIYEIEVILPKPRPSGEWNVEPSRQAA